MEPMESFGRGVLSEATAVRTADSTGIAKRNHWSTGYQKLLLFVASLTWYSAVFISSASCWSGVITRAYQTIISNKTEKMKRHQSVPYMVPSCIITLC